MITNGIESGNFDGKLNLLGIDQHETFSDTAVPDAILDLRGDIDQYAPRGHTEPQFLAVTFHNRLHFVKNYSGNQFLTK
jgi:hypothetical protein